jgi:hypothetical protein
MAPQIKKATRVGVRPLIGLYSESGCGKTFSALLLARGLVGPKGKIVMADSESGRGSLYADVIPGGYDTLELVQPFSPASYIDAIDAIEAAKADVGIIDSASHEWEGIGGVLDQAGEIEASSGKPGLHCWRKPKMEHAKFMLRMLQSSIPWIVCLRAKYKSRQTKLDGKTQIVKDEATSPIQAEDFIFEMTCHAEILQSHNIIVTKCSHPELRRCFPENSKEPISIVHGELLAKWCSNPGVAPKWSLPSSALGSELEALKTELWVLLKPVRGDKKSWDTANQWLWREDILDAGVPETAPNLTVEKFKKVIADVKRKAEKTGL